MKPVFLLYFAFIACIPAAVARQKATIVPGACLVAIDSSFKTHCGYLVVPENRSKKNGKTIQLPFVIVESKNPDKRKDPLLFTSGGPGTSSIRWATGISKSTIINDRDCIAFEQRGTHFAIPNTEGPELGDAMKMAYRKNLNKDSMMLEGVKRYRKGLEAKGIDLEAYNTDESVADIHDFLTALKIDSVNLFGISYSGGLMMAVLKEDSSRIRSVILNSPLPMFVPIDEDEPANFNEALNILFSHCEKDSADQVRYGNLKNRFQQYFNDIADKKFYIKYLEEGTKDSLNIAYDRNDLFDVIQDAFGGPVAAVPYVITDIISGRHAAYIKPLLDRLFKYGKGPNGMRISAYCADQYNYHNEKVVQSIYNAYPYMKGYHINDVYNAVCDCWKYKPVKPATKTAFYTTRYALLADGEMDNACRPLYIDMIRHYMPNSYRLLFTKRAHGVGGPEFMPILREFLNNPAKLPVSGSPDVIVY
ncbi:alpha/beta fold hydrolase [Chitinophaga sp. Cy-1792]|uniref:alpha/beta fold hydrolase n=1 Tax=Chitinophaga sp. Cy-1792 TaxID=2608339 RepID=UPI0014226541|nr:alpha/beta fold hydrolase [Chitinophaga sp. Cy-1792]NIG54064.1 alpha/beta fold hydrolase [Chitinophaga sp. Cy-1792]